MDELHNKQKRYLSTQQNQFINPFSTGPRALCLQMLDSDV